MSMVAKKEAAVRHQPVAWGSDLRAARPRTVPPPAGEARRTSETRMAAVVVREEPSKDERDPSDVPCTD